MSEPFFFGDQEFDFCQEQYNLLFLLHCFAFLLFVDTGCTLRAWGSLREIAGCGKATQYEI